MKRKILWMLAIAVSATLSVTFYRHATCERRFIHHAFDQLRSGRGSEPATNVRLKSGASATVILEHACCSGAGFDAVAIRTSDGQEFSARKNYCGLEGFQLALKDSAMEDMPQFTAFLRAEGYQKYE
jgi:hypothetical protein